MTVVLARVGVALALVVAVYGLGVAAAGLGLGLVEGVHRGPGVEVLVLEPGEGVVELPESGVMVFRVLVFNDTPVERVTLVLCGEPREMELAGSMGGGLVYEARVELPPVEDLYSWSIRVVAAGGVAETCTYKTRVVPASAAGGGAAGGEEGEAGGAAGAAGPSCPLAALQAPTDNPSAGAAGGQAPVLDGGSSSGMGEEGGGLGEWGLALTPLFAAAALAGLAARRARRSV